MIPGMHKEHGKSLLDEIDWLKYERERANQAWRMLSANYDARTAELSEAMRQNRALRIELEKEKQRANRAQAECEKLRVEFNAFRSKANPAHE